MSFRPHLFLRCAFWPAVTLPLLPVSMPPVSAASAAQNTTPAFVPDPIRVAQLAGWIAATPRTGLAPSLEDRAFWGTRAEANPAVAAALRRQAKSMARQPVPALPQELYDDFQKTGQRKAFEQPYQARLSRLNTFVLVAGLTEENPDGAIAENTGEHFVSLAEATISAILDESAWVLPAHAAQAGNAADIRTYVDLGAASRAWTLATADWLLGDRLAPSIRERIRTEVRERVLAPYLARVRSGDARGWWWVTTTNNWNAVCHAGVLGAALLLVDDAAERAEFAGAFEAATRRYVAGFGNDGFCHEGLDYWNYGFGHYVAGAETLRLATGGKVDLLADGQARRIAEFGARWQIAGGVYPAFSDVKLSPRPSPLLVAFSALRFGLGAVTGEPDLTDEPLYQAALDISLPRPAERTAAARRTTARDGGMLPLRDWFPDGGALIVRRQPAEQGLAAAFKGGNNNQPHNHNDLGSFVLVCDGRRVLTDLGGDTYVKDTFGPKRYTSGVLNSFGHPVPRVAGKLQRTGAAAKAMTMRTEFTDAADTWEIDLTSAYDVPELERLTRTFVFRRNDGVTGKGSLEIVDRVRFRDGAAPQAFGTALVLQGKQAREAVDEEARRFVVRQGLSGVRVSWDGKSETSGTAGLVVKEEPIFGIVPDSLPAGTRVGIDFARPVREATIRLRIDGE